MIPDPVNPYDVATRHVCEHEKFKAVYETIGSGLNRRLHRTWFCRDCGSVVGIG